MLALDLAGLCLFSALLVAAMVADLRWFRIPNKLVLSLLILFVAVRVPVLDVTVLAGSAAAAAAILAVGVLLYLRRIWGAGDAKFLAVVALWPQWWEAPRLLSVVAISGGVLAGGLFLMRALRGEGWGVNVPLPYGVAIAAGGLDWAISRFILVSHLI